jgi:hypothetical protein
MLRRRPRSHVRVRGRGSDRLRGAPTETGMNIFSRHLRTDLLLDYWLHESDRATTDSVEEHLMGCSSCGQRLDDLIALGAEAVRAGTATAVTNAAFVDRLATKGLRVREFRLPPNGSIDCSVAPEDEVLVGRLQAPLQGVRRLDVVQELSLTPGVQHRLADIPFDPATGEVVVLDSIARIRKLPVHTCELRLVAVEDESTRDVGRYTLRHQPPAQ